MYSAFINGADISGSFCLIVREWLLNPSVARIMGAVVNFSNAGSL